MGVDVKAIADSVVAPVMGLAQALPEAFDGRDLFARLGPTLQSMAWVVALALAAYVLVRKTAFGHRLSRGIEETIFSNWQLALLGITGLILSLASGWTTWDGMRNFTGEPLLSLMITFGIQGVMLIVAWLIGESFATGMNQRAPDGSNRRPADAAMGLVLGAMLVGAVLYWLLNSYGALSWQRSSIDIDWSKFSTVAMYFAMALIVVAIIAFNRGGDLSLPYVQSTRVIVKNAVLWVMFLACMATSVFFSFDSLFSAIFPQSERVRAAELRAQNQVAGIVADIGSTISSRRLAESERMFEAEGWKSYERQLAALYKQSEGADREIEAYYTQQMEARRSAIKAQQERITSATSGQAGLVSKKASLTDELARLKGERPGLAADLSEKKTELENRAKGVDAKRVETMAEEKGAEGTLKVGKGPVFRQRSGELSQLQDAYKIQEDRVKDAQKRLGAVDTRIAQIQRELAQVDGEIAKLKGEVDTAESRIKLAEVSKESEEGTKVDPGRVRAAFEIARVAFRQDPTEKHLEGLQARCVELYTALYQTAIYKDRVRGIDCDPKAAVEAAARVFALNSGIVTFGANCAGGDRLASNKSADALFEFSRKCLADSGLPSKETDELRTKINYIELSRDDKAHRFVVTWNAFNDGNRLAYLALAIAVAIDSLVFMSGLFGANAVRSPLSDVPSYKSRSASQLEAIIDTALIPHTYETARHVLGAMHPITPRDGFTARVVIDDGDPHAGELRRVLNAGATIGAVRHVDGHTGAERQVYEVRAELYEYLSIVAKRAFESDKGHVALAEMERAIAVALMPDQAHNSDVVLSHLHPMREDRGFMAEIKIAEVEADQVRMVRRVLNAGALYDRVQRVGSEAGHYYIHGDFYKSLSRIRARLLMSGSRAPQIAGPSGAAYGGNLQSAPAAIAREEVRQIGAPAARANPPPLPEAGAAVTPPAAESEEGLRRLILDRLVGGISPHLTQDAVVYRLGNRQLRDALAHARSALDAHGLDNKRLKRMIDEHQEDVSSALDAAYSQVRSEVRGDARSIELLDEIEAWLQRDLAILVLFPEIGLIADLIERMQAAEGHDPGLLPSEQGLLDTLRDMQIALGERNVDDPGLWHRIGRAISEANGVGDGSANVIDMAQRANGGPHRRG